MQELRCKGNSIEMDGGQDSINLKYRKIEWGTNWIACQSKIETKQVWTFYFKVEAKDHRWIWVISKTLERKEKWFS